MSVKPSMTVRDLFGQIKCPIKLLLEVESAMIFPSKWLRTMVLKNLFVSKIKSYNEFFVDLMIIISRGIFSDGNPFSSDLRDWNQSKLIKLYDQLFNAKFSVDCTKWHRFKVLRSNVFCWYQQSTLDWNIFIWCVYGTY